MMMMTGGGGGGGIKAQDSVILFWLKDLLSPTLSILKRSVLDGRRVENGSRRTEREYPAFLLITSV